MKARVGERPFLFEQVKQVSDIVSGEDYITLERTFPRPPSLHHFDFFLMAENGKGSSRADIQEQAEESRLKGAVCGGKWRSG